MLRFGFTACGQLQSRCTKVHRHIHQHTVHCIRVPHVHSGTVLRTLHMSACAMQRIHSFMKIHVRLELNTNSVCELDSLFAHELSRAVFAKWTHQERFAIVQVHFMNSMPAHDKWGPIGRCRPGGDQVQTRRGPSGDQAVGGSRLGPPLLGLHLVYTWSTSGPQIGFPRQLTITTAIITITLAVIIIVIITIICFTNISFRMSVMRLIRKLFLNLRMHFLNGIINLHLRFQVRFKNCIRMAHKVRVLDKVADQV